MTFTLPEKKYRQHHVPQSYLKAWATKEKIYCLKDGKIFLTSVKNVAVERNFYKLPNLTLYEIVSLRQFFIDYSCIPAQNCHNKFLNMFLPLILIESDNDEENEVINNVRTNVLEDYHCSIEDSWEVIKNKISNDDLSFYDCDKECIFFLNFICTQQLRTKRFSADFKEICQRYNLDISRIWPLLVHVFATNVGAGLFVERKQRKLLLLKNNTDMPFITGDQPVINLYGNRPHPPTRLSIYYPLSPSRALILGEVGEIFSCDNPTQIQVFAFNKKIAEASHSQIFGCSKHSLSGMGVK